MEGAFRQVVFVCCQATTASFRLHRAWERKCVLQEAGGQPMHCAWQVHRVTGCPETQAGVAGTTCGQRQVQPPRSHRLGPDFAGDVQPACATQQHSKLSVMQAADGRRTGHGRRCGGQGPSPDPPPHRPTAPAGLPPCPPQAPTILQVRGAGDGSLTLLAALLQRASELQGSATNSS